MRDRASVTIMWASKRWRHWCKLCLSLFSLVGQKHKILRSTPTEAHTHHHTHFVTCTHTHTYRGTDNHVNYLDLSDGKEVDSWQLWSFETALAFQMLKTPQDALWNLKEKSWEKETCLNNSENSSSPTEIAKNLLIKGKISEPSFSESFTNGTMWAFNLEV